MSCIKFATSMFSPIMLEVSQTLFTSIQGKFCATCKNSGSVVSQRRLIVILKEKLYFSTFKVLQKSFLQAMMP